MDIKKRLNNEKAVFRKEYLEFICLSGFIFLITFVFLLKSPLHIWNRADAGIDSSVFQTIALMMDNGYVPYRDTFDHKGPLIYIAINVKNIVGTSRNHTPPYVDIRLPIQLIIYISGPL